MTGSISLNSAISSLNTLSTSLNQYVVSPLNAFGLAGFVFDIMGEARAELTNEITDHYVENNSVVQDHISVKPKRVVLRNYVGEVVSPAAGSSVSSTVNTVTQKLTQLTAFLPSLAAGAQQAQTIYTDSQSGALSIPTGQSIQAAAGAAANLYGLVQNLITSQNNKQQAAYQFFKAMRDTRQLFAIQTPFEFMTNMAIESIVAIQPEESQYISNFVITLKEIRMASTTTTAVAGSSGTSTPAGSLPVSSNGGGVSAAANGLSPNPGDLQGGLAQQAAPTINNGSVAGAPPQSISPNFPPPLSTNINAFAAGQKGFN